MRGLGLLTFLAMISTAIADHNLRERLSWRPEIILRQGLGSAPWTRDPFFPATPQWSLTGIVSDQLAFINGSWVRLGERVGKYVVKKIEGNRVMLAKQKEEIVLTLRGGDPRSGEEALGDLFLGRRP